MRTLTTVLTLPLLALLGCDDKGADAVPDTDTTSTAAPDIMLSSSAMDFGEVVPGAEESVRIDITNQGDAQLNVSAISFGAPYSASLPAPFTLWPGNTIELALRCQPMDYATLSFPDVLTITSNDPDEPTVTVALSCDVNTDADADGYEIDDVGGLDCDDSDPDVHPGAEDAWYDGDDTDCSGGSDFDQDGDGFEASSYNSDPKAGGGDCQDVNASIYPEAKDDWYDGVDSNCDGANDYDADGDGYSSLAAGEGSDCDDSNADINAGNEEVFNGADDNCDGEVDWDVPGWNADMVWIGTAAGESAGSALTTGDLDGDGYDDIIIGASGASGVGIYDGSSLPADGATIADGQSHFTGSGALGTSVAFLTDFKNDSDTPAVLLGAPEESSNAGVVYAVDGSDLFFGGTTADAYFTLSGTEADQYVGRGLSQDLDLNADGVEELVGLYSDSGENYLYLLYGGIQGDHTLDDADATWSTDGSHSSAHWSVPAGGDLNGDGYDDFVHCDSSAGEGGMVWVLWGSATRTGNDLTEDLSDAATEVIIGTTNQQVGRACGIGPDTDGDGTEELWVQVPDASGNLSGIFEIAGGSALEDGNVDLTDSSSYRRRYTMRASDPGAITFSRIGDWDSDGIGDVAFGLVQSGTSEGRVYSFGSAEQAGTYDAPADAMGSAEGDNNQQQEFYGYQLSPFPVDLNADGLHDLIVADHGYDASGGADADAGALFMSLQIP